MNSKQITIDTRAELADLVKRKAEIAVSIYGYLFKIKIWFTNCSTDKNGKFILIDFSEE